MSAREKNRLEILKESINNNVNTLQDLLKIIDNKKVLMGGQWFRCHITNDKDNFNFQVGDNLAKRDNFFGKTSYCLGEIGEQHEDLEIFKYYISVANYIFNILYYIDNKLQNHFYLQISNCSFDYSHARLADIDEHSGSCWAENDIELLELTNEECQQIIRLGQ